MGIVLAAALGLVRFSFEASDLHDRARTLLGRGRHEESARLLRTVIADYRDELVKLNGGRFLSSVAAALETARSLPAPLEEKLLSFAESEARTLLPEVVPDDPSLLERAAAYFPAPTAARALHLLAILELDRGHRASATRHLRRVRQDPALASAAKSRLRLARWRAPPAPERMELAPKWVANVGGTNAVLASGTVILCGAWGLKAVCKESGDVLAGSREGAKALCAEGPRVYVQRSSHLVCLDARTLSRRWRRYSPQLVSACCGGGRVFCMGGNQLQLTCLDARTGAELWKRAVGSGEVFCDGGRVFLMGNDGGLTAFDASTGRIVWALERRGKEETSPAGRKKARPEKRFFAGMCSGLVVRTGAGLKPAAFDPLDGTEVWTYPEEGALYAGRACGLCILKGKDVSALDPVSGELLWKARPGPAREKPVGWRGAVVFPPKGRLVAYGATDGSPVQVVGRHERPDGMLLEAEGGVIVVGREKTYFLCDAREELARLEALPRSASVSIQIAEILRLLGKPEEALDRVEWIDAEAVREERVRRRLVAALAAIGETLLSKPALALPALERALRLARTQDEKARCLLALARASEAARNAESAAALCQRVIEECPRPLFPFDEHISTRASVLAQRMIEDLCRKHGWQAYARIEGRAARSGLDARELYWRFPNSMEFCRRVAENPGERSFFAAAFNSLRWREDEEAKKLEALLQAAMSPEEPRYSGLERAWFVETGDSLLRPGVVRSRGPPGRPLAETRDSLLRPEGRPGLDPPVLIFDPQRTTVSAHDRVTGKLLWRREIRGQLLKCCWAGEKLAFLCRATLTETQTTKDSVTVVEARWGRLAWSRRLPPRWRPVKSQVLFSDGEYVIAGNEFGAVVYDARGTRVRQLRGPVLGVVRGVALVTPRPADPGEGKLLRAVELQSGATVFEARLHEAKVHLFEGGVGFRTKTSSQRFELPGGRPLRNVRPWEVCLSGSRESPALLRVLPKLRELGIRPRGPSEYAGAQDRAVSGEWYVCILSGQRLELAGVPLRGKGKPWRKGYDLETRPATLLRAGRDAVLLWCWTSPKLPGKAILLDAATGEEISSCSIAGVMGVPTRYAESLWAQVRGGIACFELTPAPRAGPAREDLRRLARKGGEDFFRRMAAFFRPGLSRDGLAELARLLDMGRSAKRPFIRARKLPVNLDGELGEWKDANWVEISGLEHLWPDPLVSSSPPKPGGLSARAAVAWDARGMYVAVEVADDTDAPGDAVELHLLPRTGTRSRTLGKRLRTRMNLRSRDEAARTTRYEWGTSWKALGVVEPKKTPGRKFRSVRDFDPQRTKRIALIDIVVRDDDGEGSFWSLCLTGEALGLYDRKGFAEVEFGE